VTSFLHYFTEQLFGAPVSRSNGRWTWHCPFHDDSHPSFCVLPPKEGCKDRFRCFGCGAWGDEFDLLKRRGVQDYSERLRIIEALRTEYESEVRAEASASHRGGGVTKRDDPADVRWAIHLLADVVRQRTSMWDPALAPLQPLIWASAVCDESHIHLESLVYEVCKYVLMMSSWDAMHTRSNGQTKPGFRQVTPDEWEQVKRYRETVRGNA